MSTTAQVRTLETDNNSLYKTQSVRFTSSKSILTPTKTIPLDRFQFATPLNKKATQLNEIFKRLGPKQIKEANEDSNKQKEIESSLNRQKNRAKEGTVTFCFLDFNEPKAPTKEEVDFLTDLAYVNSDVTTIPTLSKFTDTKNSPITYSDFKNYLKKAIENINQLNHKPIMGIIPKLSRKNIPDLLEFYQNQGINTYALDLDGSNPISSRLHIFKILKVLNKMKLLDSSYIHGHNVGVRVNKMKDIIPAKDILGFGVGLNSIGEKRTEFKPNPAFISMMKTNPLNKFRLFNKQEYGYWKAISASELERVYPSDSSVPVSAFKETIKNPTQFSNLQKVFNFEQLALESHRIKEIITENSNKTMDYVRKKKYVAPDDVKILESGQTQLK